MNAEDFVRTYQSRRGLVADGIPGPKTEADLNKLLPAPASSATQFAEGLDERSANHIKSLHPKFQPLATKFMLRVRKEVGDFRITSGYRSYEEQNELYAQGRTKPGPKVTGARGGYSNHNFRLAFDITLFVNNQPVWESPLYRKAGALGETMGLDWLGGGTGEDIGDEPHYEWPGATDNVDLYRERVAKGLDVLG